MSETEVIANVDSLESPVKKKRGRPSRKAAAERAENVAKRTGQRSPEHISPTETAKRSASRDKAHDSGRSRTRSRRQASDVDNPFYIPVEEIPEGSSYEWKRHSNVGQENPFYIAQMRSQGWEPVDPRRHPNWVPPGYDKPEIIKEGMILMERPLELTQEAILENHTKATAQIAEAESRLGMAPKNTLSRQHPNLQNRVVKEWGRSVPVEE